MFRNITLFSIPNLGMEGFDAALAAAPPAPLGALELSVRGFVPPIEGDPGQTVIHSGGARWVVLGGEDKLLPGAVVAAELRKRLAAIEAKTGRWPGRKMAREIKDEVIRDMLPRAFVRPVRVDAVVDPELGVVAVDSASRKVAEAVIGHLRMACGSFPAIPMTGEIAPRSVLTGWLAGTLDLPEGMALGGECELRDPADSGVVVRVKGLELAGDQEVQGHLAAGLQCTRLALEIDGGAVTFVLGEDMVIRRLALLQEPGEDTEVEDEREARLALLALFSGELRRILGLLRPAFRLASEAT